VVVPEINKHPAGRSIRRLPVVVVPSVYVPPASALHIPLTLSVPATIGFLQLDGSRPANETSRFPLNFRHEDVTVQVPTTSPPQAVTSEHAPPPPPDPLLVPPAPVGPPEVGVQAPEINPNVPNVPNASAIARRADWTFIERAPSKEKKCVAVVGNSEGGFPQLAIRIILLTKPEELGRTRCRAADRCDRK
jgi:hypothetical protein